MKKSDSQSFPKTLALAATVAALGASVGVPSQALGFTMIETPAARSGEQSSGPNAAVIQYKLKKGQKAGANQMKERIGGVGASQLKIKKAGVGARGAGGENNMLNPQPLPPKQGTGAAGGEPPAMQK